MNPLINKVAQAMIAYDKGDARRIHHFLKVHDFAAIIAESEGLSEEKKFITEVAALVHDIGIHISEQKYGNCNGKHQEEEGPAEALKLLTQVGGFTKDQMDRICFLVGHHHTYTGIDDIDYQILLEADFLVNGYEDEISMSGILSFRENVFRTETGKRLLDATYNVHCR